MKSLSEDDERYEVRKQELKTFNKVLRRTINHAKKIYYTQLFDNFKK